MAFSIPDWLAERNRASWRQVVAHYEEFAAGSNRYADELHLVRQLAESDRATAFRAGTSLSVLMISTAVRNGLQEGEPFVAISPCRDGRFRLEYRSTTGGEIVDQRTCDTADVILSLEPMLARLWNERASEHEMMKRWAMESPHAPSIATKAGRVRFKDVVPGVTLFSDIDDEGAERHVILEHDGDLHPCIIIEDDAGTPLAFHFLPERARLMVREGQSVPAGAVLATRHRDR